VVWPRILEEVPAAELHVFYGCYNWEEAIKTSDDHDGRRHLGAIKELLQQPRIHVHGRLGQRDLAKEVLKSAVLAQPSWCDETFGISYVEAMLGGAIVVATRRGGVTTTVGRDRGILIDGSPGFFPGLDEDYMSRWVPAAVDVLKRPEKYADLRRRARAHAEQFSVERVVGERWIPAIRALLARRAASIGAGRTPLPVF
jgi:glycosyltransferase involved in cell wall biosynthesis